MATVYKAKCHVLNRYVAVKVLKDEFITDEEFVKRFNTEAQAVASLTHPNIVSVYDVGHEGELYYIVMELIQGKTLKDIIVSDGALNWKWSVNIAIQIASALETAHKNNIIHRDIKPHNIIITEDGIAKVTDFGIAKSVSNSTITAFGTTLGSVHYFSPEHARGGITDAKSDIYSLGVVIYEMITGKVPFDADTPVSVALKHMQEIPKEPITINPAIPLALNKIVMKAMKKDPALRYQSATEMIKDLTLALKNPDGNFVSISATDNDFATQVVPTINGKKNIEDKIKEKDKKKTKPNFFIEHKALTIVIALVLLFAVSFGGITLLFDLTRNKDVQIPNLVGLTQEQVKEKLKKTKLKYVIEEEKYDDEIDKGLMISQDPEYRSDYKIKENTEIKLVISLGQKIVKVPKVVGKTEQEARALLDEQDLEVILMEEYDKKVEKGIVISQDIEANTELAAGKSVTITVSKGIEETIVPNVLGKPKEDAVKELEEAGLTISATLTEQDSTKGNNTILKQSLEPGSTVEKGTTLTITVNEIAQIVNATATINLKSILNYASSYDGSDYDPYAEDVELKVVVDNDTVYSARHKENETKIKVNFSGVGTVTVKLYADDILKQTKQVNLSEATTVTFE